MAEDLLSRIRAEIDARMRELRPLVDEYEQMRSAADALGLQGAAGARTIARGARASAPGPAARSAGPVAAARPSAGAPRERAARGAAQQAILAALEHGSHTVSELVVVTAMPAPSLRDGLRRLQQSGAVTRASREGKAAYALSR